MNCGQVYCGKVGNGQRLCHCENSHFGGEGYTQTAQGIWISDVKFVWETFTMPMLWQNMNSGQVCCGKSCRKSWQFDGQRLCNCANSPLGGGGRGVHAHRQGECRKWMLISCDRPSQCLCCGRI